MHGDGGRSGGKKWLGEMAFNAGGRAINWFFDLVVEVRDAHIPLFPNVGGSLEDGDGTLSDSSTYSSPGLGCASMAKSENALLLLVNLDQNDKKICVVWCFEEREGE